MLGSISGCGFRSKDFLSASRAIALHFAPPFLKSWLRPCARMLISFLHHHAIVVILMNDVVHISVVNPCDPSPCANNGNCTAMGPFNYICQCAPNYTGPTCEDEIDACLSIACPNNSMCVNGSLCVCLPGFELIGDVCKPTGTL